jgi:hypothetical protein
VRIQRLEEISEEDAKAEGVMLEPCTHPDCQEDQACAASSYKGTFAVSWNKINGNKHPWGSKCWVWAIDLMRVA